MSEVTRDEMATAELNFIGKPVTKNNVESFVVWMTSEDTTAEWNPHATTEEWAGATQFNSAGVKNYPNIQAGLEAFKTTINNGRYAAILDCLSRSAVPAETCATITNSAWGSKPSPELVGQVLTDFPIYADVIISGSKASTPITTQPQPVPSVPTTEDNVNVPTIQNGSSGNPVKAVQAILNEAAGAGLNIDGAFGPKTEGAVKAWQSFWHITVDGVVGPKTWGTLVVL